MNKDHFLIKFLVILIALHWSDFSFACQSWFKENKLKPGPGCVEKCSMAPIDMDSFDCSAKCQDLCNPKDFKLEYSYLRTYGISDEEIKYCESNVAICVEAYLLGRKAESLCSSIYQKSGIDDESDACRHYVWGMLLARKLGVDVADKILTAHEANPNEKIQAKSMDLANNKSALVQFGLLNKGAELKDSEILVSYKAQLEKGALVVIKPKSGLRGSKK